MKLKNKATGEIGWLYCDHISIPKKMTVFAEDKDLSAIHWDYSSLAELNEEWEDYEEPKAHYSITRFGDVVDEVDGYMSETIDEMKKIGNYFESKEEAELAVEKLKAYKRLKDKGFEIVKWTYDIGDDHHKAGQIVLNLNNVRNNEWDEYDQMMEIKKDLDLLFGGEE